MLAEHFKTFVDTAIAFKTVPLELNYGFYSGNSARELTG